MQYRTESDFLGKVRVPKDAYYGPETQRAVNNFQISGLKISWNFIESYVMIKKAAAIANMRTGKLDKRTGKAIIAACNDVLKGELAEHFVTDVFQAGAGTNTNMNVNEVLANRAITILRGKKGNYRLVNPNDHVNMSQSTNDTFHCAIHVSCYLALSYTLIPELDKLAAILKKKSRQFYGIIKVGRTHIQDAVPIRLGQEFYGYYGSVAKIAKNLKAANGQLLELPLGGTAIGTGINAGKAYPKFAIKELNRISKAKFFLSDNNFKVMQSLQDELSLSDTLKEIASATGKIASDLRLLSSGPHGGINEIILPAVQPGSSIMPGKVNPSIPEMMNMVGFEVTGLSHATDIAAASGQLELNVFMPIVAYNLLFSINILSNAISAFADNCIAGIRPNKVAIEEHLKTDLSMVTSLSPCIGYSMASKLGREAYLKGKSLMDVCMEHKVLDKKTLARLLDPKNAV